MFHFSVVVEALPTLEIAESYCCLMILLYHMAEVSHAFVVSFHPMPNKLIYADLVSAF